MEIYKDVPGYEGVYKVSNYGNVQSRKTKGKWKLIGKGKSKSYPTITLRDGVTIKTTKVHILVINLFKEKIIGKPFVNHIDNNCHNNHIDNLEWVDNRENMSHSWINTRRKTSKFIGVCWKKREQKWSSEIYVNKKRYFLGMFNSEFEASIAYRNKLKEFNISNVYS